MTRVRTIVPVFFLIAIVTGCAVAQRSGSKTRSHHENLTDLRLSFPAIADTVIRVQEEKDDEIYPPLHAVNDKVDEVLDSIARFNKARLFVDGYTIQIYSGLRREDAMNAKKIVMEGAKDLVADLRYEQPKWRLKTGSYHSRLEAQRDLHRLKRIFPNAILVPEKVALK